MLLLSYIMKKSTTINLDTKSQLAKLLATENIIIQHNAVSTASFNTKTRVLTLPIFKESHGDVYDMLIAHECAHALFTPQDGWKKIQDDDELRTYVNVLEDTRIDKKIQKKYPGVVRNYINGFDILEKQNFFGMNNKDLNKDLMLIDKINLRSKSSQRIPFIFTPDNNKWLAKVDAIKTFADVVRVAKEMLNWQKKQVEDIKKLPDFDDHPLIKNYDLSDEDGEDPEDSKKQDVKSDENSDEQDEKNDKRDSEEKESEDRQKGTDEDLKEKEKAKSPTQHAKGAGGDPAQKKLKAITNDFFEEKKEQLLDKKTSYVYGTLPTPNYNQILVSYKEFLNDFRTHINNALKDYPTGTTEYRRWLLDKFKRFRTENKKTVMYLVKEFEMKKAASAYKRANTDKTGIIDPLKLKNYKFSEDIFKRITILPDGKNHGMIMLLDWSGSMSDCIADTINQLINLVEFVRKVNIPFEVYFFTSERDKTEKEIPYWKYKYGDFAFDDFKLVNCVSHRMKKNEFEEALLYLFHMATSYDYRWNRYDEYPKGTNYQMPDKYWLGNTPLNEALLVCNSLVPEFLKKYKVEKLTFITLTDGGANGFRHNQIVPIPDKPTRRIDELDIEEAKKKGHNYIKKSCSYDSKIVITHKNRKIVLTDGWYGSAMTETLLDIIKKDYNPTIIGFYVMKRIRRWDLDRFIGDYRDYDHKEKLRLKIQKDFRVDNAAIVKSEGYDKYFLLNGKKMKIQNFNLQDATVKKGTGAELKRIFGKSMKNRLVSRVVLNKFIAEVA